jgi:hypothetical protein
MGVLQKQQTPAAPPVVTVHDSYHKGTHTLTGSLFLPNACTSLAASATVITLGSSTQAIALALSAPVDTETCLQVPTKVLFSTTVSASSTDPIVVTVNGASASTTPQ